MVLDSLLFAAGFAYGPTSTNVDFWVRELSSAGLPAPAQQELLQCLAWTIDCGAKYFPDSPLAYAGSMKELLHSTFLPRKGPIVIANALGMASEVFSRIRAWELAYLELSMLDAKSRPSNDVHATLVDVVCLMARNDFPHCRSAAMAGGTSWTG